MAVARRKLRKKTRTPLVLRAPSLSQPLGYRPPPKPFTSIFDAIDDDDLFGPWFKDKKTWKAWFVFLKCLFAIPFDKEDYGVLKKCTGRDNPPRTSPQECYLLVGRRAGKSSVLSMVAVFLACFFDWSPYLSPGEKGHVFVVASDRKQARVIFYYIQSYLNKIPFLHEMKIRETMESFELNNNIIIEIQTASFRGVRGYTIVAALLDEIAFWSTDDSANPDFEILNALRPAMATIPGSMMLCASSPFAERGVLFQAYDKFYGREIDDILVWQAPTIFMNPTFDRTIIKRAYERDPVSASSEYGALFRVGSQAFIDPKVIKANVSAGCFEIPPQEDIEYFAFTDPSGGSRDSFTLAIAHDEEGTRVLDVIREVKPPFSPEEVVQQFAQLIKEYHMYEVTGDKYGGEWPTERFQTYGIDYVRCKNTKTILYLDLLPLLNSRRCRLLENETLIRQLAYLERKSSTRTGAEYVDHPSGSFDDVINAAAGALTLMREYAPLEMW